ncbi:restriction endonuclease subunit S [Pseudanabaena sp. FACHB-1277]|uniref:Restriction endonuclease subunit S n=1 Tax=Pseudanabaena cinerea FACHB-1277 TaxID=2949581 RepID=A0A926UUT1_9CYAN|nr:restriction endonuclease subunit S [Pseudanabaena cinerea]MBD2151246.1 restriction endonuclease subunit S [Pseudanabaena cinerea FACHB-1277]
MSVPKLRFPEFRDAGEWEEKNLGDVTYKTDKRNKEGKKYPIYSINNKVGFVPQAEQFEGVDSNKRGYDITLYKIINKRTFAYNPARINVGSIGYSEDLDDIIVSSLYVCFKSTDVVIDKYLKHFFDTEIFNQSVNNNVEGGIRNYLFYENFSTIKVSLPTLPEQQKIADCLSSIDDRITLEAQKLDTLKAHKKGLMQQLFPAEGETLPKLRFPEFWDAGEWEEKKLGEIASFYKGKGISKSDINDDGVLPCVRYGELYTHYQETINSIVSRTNLAISDLFIGSNNDVLMPSSGETKLDIATASCLLLDGVALGGDINVIRCNQNGVFMSYYLNSHKKFEIAKIAQGDTVVHLYSSQLKQKC